MRAREGLKQVRKGLVLQMVAGPVSDAPPRAGFTATKKIGNAVIRNRAKRRLREAARLLLPEYGRPGFDYVFIARAATPEREWAGLLDDVKSALVSLRPASAQGQGETAQARAKT